MLLLFLLWLHILSSAATPADDRDDATLLQAFKNTQNPAVLGVLFNRYIHIVFGICMKYLKDESAAEDATADLFELLLQKVPQHDIDHFAGWLTTVTRNHCLMHLRKKQTLLKNEQAYHQTNHPSSVEWDEPLHLMAEEKEQLLQRLQHAMEQLKPEQRTCVALFFIDGCSYHEVMDKTGWDYKTVKSHIQNGKRNLKKLMA